ncbi:hypothetical protein, variant [Aphanomyces astaci]|uniref:BRCA1-associated protein n=1 Tax=Aphanomyces astaci TaxID=112090 RepID=W4FUE2_APHAT|nr:hypothetical protein, variant [Aphanomyces astaci]ETV71105.1 hypothetical protein, variant [Aphanomyces astaci]|eukprot:XP_009839351.1 hypothetical protein, variant [Aphanomyces astaci]
MFHVRLEQAAAASCSEEEKPTIEFEVGNPRVELLTGRLRLFRSLETTDDESKDEGDDAAGALSWLPIPRDAILGLDLTLLGFVSLPMHMGPLELIEFSKAFRSDIVVIRLLRDSDPRHSSRMALMQFSSANKAAQFYEAFNGSLFNSMEPERCRLVFVHNIEFIRERADHAPPLVVNGHAAAQGMLPVLSGDCRRDAPEGHVEIPTCPVCLDRLDTSASGILTTLCNHTFHCDCLFRWEGSSCPVCRYSHGDIVSACEVCDTTDHLWICLICGHIGCGRYSNEHAKKHYQDTLHTYSLELETQRVCASLDHEQARRQVRGIPRPERHAGQPRRRRAHEVGEVGVRVQLVVDEPTGRTAPVLRATAVPAERDGAPPRRKRAGAGEKESQETQRKPHQRRRQADRGLAFRARAQQVAD